MIACPAPSHHSSGRSAIEVLELEPALTWKRNRSLWSSERHCAAHGSSLCHLAHVVHCLVHRLDRIQEGDGDITSAVVLHSTLAVALEVQLQNQVKKCQIITLYIVEIYINISIYLYNYDTRLIDGR